MAWFAQKKSHRRSDTGGFRRSGVVVQPVLAIVAIKGKIPGFESQVKTPGSAKLFRKTQGREAYRPAPPSGTARTQKRSCARAFLARAQRDTKLSIS